MADVKWIKMMVGMFDGMSFKKIKRAKIGGESYRDKLTAVWFELMDLAARCNHNGALIGTDGIPFTDLDEIAVQIDRDEDELKLCMAFYMKERMVSIIEDNVYSLANWGVYQNIDGMEKIREQTRKRVAEYRDRQKQKQIGPAKKCVYCGEYGDTVDHVIPKAHGGLDVPENMVCACLACNMQKNDHDVAKFLNDRLRLNEQIDIASIEESDVLRHHVRFDREKKLFVTLRVTQGNALEEEGEEDKELDKDIEIDRENEIPFDQSTQKYFDEFSTGLSTVDDTKRKMIGGELGQGVVFLSNAQMDDLLDKLSLEEFNHYVSVVAECILKGKPFRKKTHYQAILDMAAADRKLT